MRLKAVLVAEKSLYDAPFLIRYLSFSDHRHFSYGAFVGGHVTRFLGFFFLKKGKKSDNSCEKSPIFLGMSQE